MLKGRGLEGGIGIRNRDGLIDFLDENRVECTLFQETDQIQNMGDSVTIVSLLANQIEFVEKVLGSTIALLHCVKEMSFVAREVRVGKTCMELTLEIKVYSRFKGRVCQDIGSGWSDCSVSCNVVPSEDGCIALFTLAKVIDDLVFVLGKLGRISEEIESDGVHEIFNLHGHSIEVFGFRSENNFSGSYCGWFQ